VKLGSLKQGGRDGTLVVVDRSLSRYAKAPDIADTLQQALDDWSMVAPQLEEIYVALNRGTLSGSPLRSEELAAPLPRAFQWLDGSAYLSHVERVRKARGAVMPPEFLDDPLMYQGGADVLLGAQDDICVTDVEWGADFEAEVAVVCDDVPQGVSFEQAGNHIKLLMLVNDVSLRNLIPAELAKGFGFLHGKPPTAFSPVAVTPDEFGDAWRDCKVHLPLQVQWNGQRFGNPDAGADMQFSFARLIQHAAKTRPLGAGTIIGSGTVSNADATRGHCCIAERRAVEMSDNGAASTPFLQFDDRVRIEMLDDQGNSVFGAIEQRVQPCRS